jgi:hypothetical protein
MDETDCGSRTGLYIWFGLIPLNVFNACIFDACEKVMSGLRQLKVALIQQLHTYVMRLPLFVYLRNAFQLLL